MVSRKWTTKFAAGLVCLFLLAYSAMAEGEPAHSPPAASDHVCINDVVVRGMIEGENIRFQLDFTAECAESGQWLAFLSGDVALEKVAAPVSGFETRYEPAGRRYVMRWPGKGTYKTSLTFAARPKVAEGGAWREVEFDLPSSRLRDLEIVCDRADLEVRFPGALRVTREAQENKLTMKAILGPGLPFAVRWKPQVEELGGALVLACDANTIASVRAGAVRLDSLYLFEISQGKLREMSFIVPKALSVTQVRGAYVRDWRVEESAGARRLKVVLNRPVTRQYPLQVVSELSLAAFPTQIEMPVLQPEGMIRSVGHLALGTDSAIHMLVGQTAGLSQTEPSGFPLAILDKEHARPVPAGKAFFYSYASTPYAMTLALDDIVPSYDAVGRCVAQVREDELSIETAFELDVRDAPLREVTLEAPAVFAVAAVTGEQVLDYAVRPAPGKAQQEVAVRFRQPVLGRTLVRMRLELGHSPLDVRQAIEGIGVRGAKGERGFVVVAADRSVQVETPAVTELREVTAASVPLSVPDTQFAYRYRDRGWSLTLAAAKKPSGLMAESFHLVSLGEGALYGCVVVNYVISGAPVDEFRFRVPRGIENVEFVGGDIRRWSREGEAWVVKLQRKVIGDYNLAVSYSHPWKASEPVTVGGIECEGMERRSGFICVSSRMNLQVQPAEAPDSSLLEIKNEEIPPNYRLLLNAPILKAYKYVAAPDSKHAGVPGLPLKIETYERAAVLPAVIELMELKTELNITDAGATESVTRIRYKVKNASDQFLTLSLPERATVWSTRLIERGVNGSERATELTPSLDAARKVMMVPLKRLRDPNSPMTIELVYGQEHPEIQGGGRLTLGAPNSGTQTAYALWTVTAPKDWAALPARGGNMAAQERRAEFRDLGDVGRAVVASWVWAFSDGLPAWAVYLAGVVAVALAVLVLALRGRWLGRAVLAVALLALLWGGIRAASAPAFDAFTGADDLRTLTYTRALGLDDATGMTVSARVAPAWRRDATVWSALVIPAIGLALILAALRHRRAGPVLLAVGLAGVLSAVARFPAGAKLLVHLFTWGAPVLLLLWLAPRAMWPVRRPAAVAAGLAFLLMAGRAGDAAPMPERPTVDRAFYELSAEKDSMKVSFTLHLTAPAPALLALPAAEGVLLSKEKISRDVELVRQNGTCAINVKKKGTYDLKLEFLYALSEAGENTVRHFRLPVPFALTSQVELRIPDKEIEVAAPTAVSFTKTEAEDATVAKVLLGPGDPIEFAWKPRARERSLEATAFYADILSRVRFDTGLARGRHRIRLQIAQGEIKEVRVRAPENMTVTAVEGEGLGAWRFNPETHEMEARLAQPVGGEYALIVTTQITAGAMPATIDVAPVQVLGATNQREVLGLTTSAAVQIAPSARAGGMNVEDFTREAAALAVADPVPEPVRYAYRLQSMKDVVSVAVTAVRPEIRSVENASFTVSDERLVYNGEIRISVAKAGVFSLDLSIPEGYDIDTFVSPEMSHWDEALTKGRVVQVHFRNKLLGETALKIALSRPVGELPEEIAVPRIGVVESLKHGGQVSITSSRNVRLSVKSRAGVSELNVTELGIRTTGALAFNLLRPDWELALKTEVVKPRVNVEFLHVAEVSDGIVRHTHYLRYRFHNAGQKVLEVQAPKGALGLEISGAEIAHLKESEPGSGLWRIELARRQYDEPYLLKLRFETQYDRSKGEVVVSPSTALDVEMQRGNVVAYSTDRVELAEASVDPVLQPGDARGMPRTFGAGDLSGAAFCYRCPELPYRLTFRATRHAAVSLLEATVLQTDLDTVLSETGETITHTHLRMQVGSKRHLEVRLPVGARVWSLSVNQRSEVPSRRRTDTGETLLIPLAQAAAGDLPVEVDLIHVVRPGSGAAFADQLLRGPEFDLPLQQVHWRLFLPERYRYTDFESTLNVNAETLHASLTQVYDVGTYEQRVQQFNTYNREKALQLQAQGNQLAQSGKPQEARQALSWANNYALNDPELDEDTRVQLHSLMRDQAVVAIVGRRGQLRHQKGEAAPVDSSVATGFDQAQAERVRNSLNRDDNANLDRIIGRLIEMQEEASQSRVQLMVNAPLRGRVIDLTRGLQVKPGAEMSVSFKARRELPAQVKRSWVWGAGLAALLLALFLADRALARWRRAAAQAPAVAEPTAPR